MNSNRQALAGRVMGSLMTVIYLFIPLACAAAVAFDIWSRGFGAPTLQVGLGIFGLLATSRLVAWIVPVADDVAYVTHRTLASASKRLDTMRKRTGDAVDSLMNGQPSLSEA
jgi:hypothetical protein